MSEISAYHEAGHAMMAMIAGARILSVTIEPDWDDGPQRHADIQIQWPTERFDSRELSEKLAMVALAGPAAEMIHTGDPYHPGLIAEWKSDWELAWEAAAPRFPDPRKRLAYLEQITARAYRILAQDDFWAALATIVDNLLAHETLEGEEVEEIVQQWIAVGGQAAD
ncbi:hypothetical protein [Rosistilla oblonga]|uniref:ATP-dependent zinc metalloprotease FtsH n=1 Tax=Rosistilla oblonga TaxID=2527990 RepID=A0A518IR95_9BACT|nr:hypothetical protein [Rosistilla oblonga]QDV55611.1 ATP-dependent zinc metalloprotease FtsH [Rosistilla oblonga]